MPVNQESIAQEIAWYRNELSNIRSTFELWLNETGHNVNVTETKCKIQEELTGEYEVSEYSFLIDNTQKLTFVPYGIYIVGAKGRIDIKGDSGKEKLVYLWSGGPSLKMETQDSSGNVIESSVHRYYDNVDNDGWYLLDDSMFRRVEKFSKENVMSLLERLK